jgi:hypothetical protein
MNFLWLLNTEKESMVSNSNVDEMCNSIRTHRLVYGVESGRLTQGILASFYSRNKNMLVTTDVLINGILQQGENVCILKQDSRVISAIFKWNSITNQEIGSILKSYAHRNKYNLTLSQNLPVVFTAKATSYDVKNNYQSILNRSLSDSEMKFLMALITNAKLRMIKRLQFLLGNNTRIPSTIHFSSILDESVSSDIGKGRSVRSTTFYEKVVDNGIKRIKRAFWTDSLSEITGLARQVDIDKALSNEEKIVAAEKHDEEEIEILEERSNLILEDLKHNSEKLIKLYGDEKELQRNLGRLLIDETKLQKNLAAIVSTLETLSDVATEYESIAGFINLIPNTLIELEESVLSVSTQTLYPSILKPDLIQSRIRKFVRESLLTVRIETDADERGFKLMVRIPEYSSVFKLVRVHTLPFAPDHGVYTKFKVDGSIIGINDMNETF